LLGDLTTLIGIENSSIWMSSLFAFKPYLRKDMKMEKTPNVTKYLYTPQEIKDILGISKSDVYEILHQKKIECVKINRRFFISKKSLENFIGMKIE